jgi:hypothetical protein
MMAKIRRNGDILHFVIEIGYDIANSHIESE